MSDSCEPGHPERACEPSSSGTGPSDRLIGTCLGLLGAIMGGTLGYFGFRWLLSQGFYGIVLPGTLLGIGCGALSGRRSMGLGAVCAVAGLALGIFIEWSFFPFIRDRSLSFFLLNLHRLRALTLFLIALGGFFAFWFGIGREGGAWLRRTLRHHQGPHADVNPPC